MHGRISPVNSHTRELSKVQYLPNNQEKSITQLRRYTHYALFFLIALNDSRSKILRIIFEIILFLFIAKQYRLEIFHVFGFSVDLSDAEQPLLSVGVSLERQIPERFAFQGVF